MPFRLCEEIELLFDFCVSFPFTVEWLNLRVYVLTALRRNAFEFTRFVCFYEFDLLMAEAIETITCKKLIVLLVGFCKLPLFKFSQFSHEGGAVYRH